MQKIISLFARNYAGDRLVRNEMVPGAEWVQAGEGIASRKFDGTCCLVRAGALLKRYDAKRGKTPPPGFEPAQDPDPVTGHWPGWVPVDDSANDARHREAFSFGWAFTGRRAGTFAEMTPLADGTHELCGPKINGNPEGLATHVLIRHGAYLLEAPTAFEDVRQYLANHPFEGLVWLHPDGRMVKIKRRDFGLEWPIKATL
jgi:hypothetical protein